MKKRRTHDAILAILIAFVLFLILFEPAYGPRLRSFFAESTGPGVIVSPNLAAENEILKARLAEKQTVGEQVPVEKTGYIPAMVYSRYPLNFKNEITVNVGSQNGIRAGAAVLFEGIFIGTVKSASPDSAVVRTVFDNSFKMPVRIGGHGYDGLFQGGAYPVIASINKNAALAKGDIVTTAMQGLPYGLPIGEVDATSTSPDGLFGEATLTFAYSVDNAETVLIAVQP